MKVFVFILKNVLFMFGYYFYTAMKREKVYTATK